MKKSMKKVMEVLMVFAVVLMVAAPVTVFAATEANATVATTEEASATTDEDDSKSAKAVAAAIAVGLAAAGGAIGMGMGISKSVEGISRQPEAEGKIRTTLMLGLVFVETAIIYALVIAILIIFVL